MNAALLLLPDFALILLGAAIRRWMHLGDHFWSGVEKLVYFILFPALLVNAIIKTRLRSRRGIAAARHGLCRNGRRHAARPVAQAVLPVCRR